MQMIRPETGAGRERRRGGQMEGREGRVSLNAHLINSRTSH